MKFSLALIYLTFCVFLFDSCRPSSSSNSSEPTPNSQHNLNYTRLTIDGKNSSTYYSTSVNVPIQVSFSAPVDLSSLAKNVFVIKNSNSVEVELNFMLQNNDSTLVITPKSALDHITTYTFKLLPALQSKQGQLLNTTLTKTFTTVLDSSDKFPRISDDELLTLVQKQTFKYFWDLAHPISGLARERNTSGDIVTSGGSGFGVMAIIVAIERGFITKQEGLERITKITNFLTDNVTKYHGAFPHWFNGATGATIPFSTKDNGADLVETSLLMQGLLTARQYFKDTTNLDEASLKTKINALWNNIEWTWFQKNNENTLYWHWSPNYNWDMNMPIAGWNEALVIYVLAASSNTHAISKDVYTNGWTRNGAFINGKNFYGIKLPLGSDFGGPLFFSHYSFLGLDPNLMTDEYTNYGDQCRAHSLINYNYCKSNPKSFNGYSAECWGLTASDNNINGYSAHEPTNDLGVISPTAALSSFPYSPNESMKALKFFYYKLGDKIFKQYGFVDAFNLSKIWFADSYLAIDQGPIIIMIENHRSQLIWNLFMSSPEIQSGLTKLGLN